MAIQKVWIDEGCTLCELCAITCPEVFSIGDESAEVQDGADFNSKDDCIRESADICPAEVIHYSE